MPPSADKHDTERSLQEVVDALGVYPIDAFFFLQEGLSFAVQKTHPKAPGRSRQNRHVTGQQLCECIRELASDRWGRMAGEVLRSWGITRTVDFGRMVFALVDSGLMFKTDEDSLEDFTDVFDFHTAFETSYRIVLEI